MNVKIVKEILLAIAKPFIAKKTSEIMDGTDRPTPDQISTQVGKIVAGASIAMLTQVESPEATIAMIVVLVVNLVFIYYPEKKY